MPKLITVIGGLFIHIATTQSSWGWGHQGHAIVASSGSGLAVAGKEFWGANRKAMSDLTNVPDQLWKQRATYAKEKENHFFQIDFYFQNAADYPDFPRAYGQAVERYTQAVVKENGTAPWRIQQFFDVAVDAVAKGDFVNAVEMAGVMSHYIGDLSQPLHVTQDYDGQLSSDGGAKTGIHKFFETDNIEAHIDGLEEEVTSRATLLLKDKNFLASFKGSLSQSIFKSVERSHLLKDAIIEADKKSGREGKGSEIMIEIAKKRLADGAATLAMVLGRIWTEGGSPKYGATVNYQRPAFIDPSFDPDASYLDADDCQH